MKSTADSSTAPGAQDGRQLEANNTDLGNAERFAAMHSTAFRYVADLDIWIRWTGSHWARVSGLGPLRRAATKVTKAIYAEASRIGEEVQRAALARHALRSESRQRLDSMIELASAQRALEVSAGELDSHPLLLSCGNGTLDLASGELRQPERADLISRATPVHFDAAGRAPRWERFLHEVFEGHEDLIGFMQRAMGYSLTGRVDAQCFFLLHGSGCNGKSILLSILVALLGENAMTAPFETLVAKRQGEGVPNDIAAMRGARVVVASESEEGAQLAESRVKTLTGGDRVSARFMRGEYFEFQPVLKLWLATNYKPAVRGTGPAIWRRMKLVPFLVDFRGREDPKLQADLMAELPGVLAWAVRGCQDWLADGGGAKGLDVSCTVREATEAYREDSDIFGQFLDERTVRDAFAAVSSEELFNAYLQWSECSKRRAMSKQLFGRKMTERGYPSSPSNGQRIHRGLGLQNGSQPKHGTLEVVP